MTRPVRKVVGSNIGGNGEDNDVSGSGSNQPATGTGAVVNTVVNTVRGAAPSPSPSAPRPATRTRQFALREQLLDEQAATGGAQRSANDADLLGNRAAGARRKSLGREILG